jgi:leucyl aminopeptidase
MKITFAESARTDIAAFIVDEGGRLPAAAAALDKASGGLLTEALDGSRFDGKSGQHALVVLPKGLDARRVMLMGGGKPKKRDARGLENLGANLVKTIASSGFKTAAITADDAESAARVAVGAKLAAYRFDTYFTKLKPEQKPSLTGLTIVSADPPPSPRSMRPATALIWRAISSICRRTISIRNPSRRRSRNSPRLASMSRSWAKSRWRNSAWARCSGSGRGR